MGKKSLCERLSESWSRPDAQDSAKRFAKFLLICEEVEKSFREGWSYKEIWRVLHRDGDIDYSYSSFLNYIRKVKRRRHDCDKEKTPKTTGGGVASAPGGKPPMVRPGSTKVDLPQFGQEARPRDPKRF